MTNGYGEAKDEKLEREYPEVRSDFYLEIYDKRLINMLKK